ncbi:MAG TPA: hypothetical protein VFU89_06365 [Rhabdochlamydiaceae bacterium]|nr:hypothetical protein [Rhabdochlamydiaceae bacterium]
MATALLKRMNPSQATAPLKAAETSSESLETAYEFIGSQQYGKARSLLLKFLKSFEPADENPIRSAQCHIAMAHTYPGKANDSEKHVLQAKNLLNIALAKILQLSKEEKIKSCLGIRSIYRELANLEKLVTSDELTVCDDVNDKIEECSKHIPALWDFYDQLVPILDIPEESNPEKVKRILDDALQILGQEGTSDFVLAKAVYHGLFAKAFPKGCLERTENSELALTFALKAHSQINLFIHKHGNLFVYERFRELFLMLQSLLPQNAKISELYNKLQTLAPENRVRKNHRVSKGPVGDPLKVLRLFVILAFAFVVIGSVVLNRRYTQTT